MMLFYCSFVYVSVNMSFSGHEDGGMLLRLSKYISMDTLMSKPGKKLSQCLDDFWHISRSRKDLFGSQNRVQVHTRT